MGQKINPIGLRLGVNRTWDSRWFAGGADYAKLLHQDLKLREWLRERLAAAGVSRIIIERPHKKCRVSIHSARPGVVIGKKGEDIELLKADLNRRMGVQHCVAGPSALIGASNFFELAVAAAISLFGFQSGAALATVVGVLIEVPVMLSVVWIVNRSKGWYERGEKPRGVAEAKR